MASLKTLADMIDAELDDADRAHLRRWLGHPDGEQLWARLSRLRERRGNPYLLLDDRSFVRMILGERQRVTSEQLATAEVKRQGDEETENRKLVQWTLRRVASDIFTQSPILLRLMAENIELIPDHIRSWIKTLHVVTKKTSKSPRRRYAEALSEEIHFLVRRWCDADVATLTEIAFPGEEITDGMVRSYRRKK